LFLLLAVPGSSAAQFNETKLIASDGAVDDYFGWAISLSGNRFLVSANHNPNGVKEAGFAYIFYNDGSGWVEQTKLEASDRQEFDRFGYSAYIFGDHAIMGAIGDDDNGPKAGSAYAFRFDGSGWVEQKLLPGDGQAGDFFGYDVSIWGDYALIGAVLDDDNGTDAGAAYLFEYNGTAWVEVAKIKASDGESGDNFGTTVALSDSLALIGAFGDEDTSGSVYVYRKAGATLVEDTKLRASDAGPLSHFGRSLSLYKNYAMVGAPYHGEDGADEGAAYIFRHDGTNWVEEARLTSSDIQLKDHFGRSVWINGDYAMVGVTREDELGDDAGAAYLFHFDGTSWVEQAKILPSDGVARDHFGRLVIVSGDTAFVASTFDDNEHGRDAGSVYVYSGFYFPGAVAPLAPADSATINADSVIFSWNEGSPNIDRYWLELATDSAFVTAVIDSGITDTAYTLWQLQDSLTYWWRVRAHNTNGWGPYSATRTFTVDTPPVPPLLLSPVNGAVGVPTTLFLHWHPTADPGQTSYNLQLGLDSLFSSLVLEDSTITDTTYELSSLTNGTTYYWRVRAKHATEYSPWSGTWRFRTILPLPGSVTLIEPGDSSTVNAFDVRFLWSQASPEVTLYWIEYSTDSSFTAAVIDSTVSDTMHVVSELEDSLTYWWKVRGQNEAGWGPYSPTWTFAYANPPPAPLLASPANGAMNIPVLVSLFWHPVEESDSTTYHLQLATDSVFTAIIGNDSTLTDTSHQVIPLENGVVYYWRVRVVVGEETGPWSEVWFFRTIVSLPGPVTLVLPPDSAVIRSDSTVFVWLHGEPEVDRYWFELATDSSFTTAAIDSAITDTTHVATGLLDSLTYWWRVRAHNAAGWGAFGHTRTFAVNLLPSAPTLVSPTDGAVDVPTVVTFAWEFPPQQMKSGDIRSPNVPSEVQAKISGGSGATRREGGPSEPVVRTDSTTYRLQLATDSLFVAVVLEDSAITDTSFVAGPLLNSTDYYWRVNVTTLDETSPWSETWTFRTIVPLPDQVTLVSPSDSATVNADSVIFLWLPVTPEADRYWLEYATDSSFAIATIDSGITDTVHVVSQLLDSRTYWWRVRAHNAAGWGAFSQTRSFTVDLLPPAPLLSSPADGTVDLPTIVTLVWYPVSQLRMSEHIGYHGAVRTDVRKHPGGTTVALPRRAGGRDGPEARTDSILFRVQLATDSLFTSVVLDDSTVTDTFLVAGPLLNSTSYYWRVSATVPDETSPWSEVWTFRTIVALPGGVALLSPSDSADVNADSVMFLWLPATPEVDRYWLEYATDSAFATAAIDSAITDTTRVVSQLQDSQTYWWRVRAHNTAGWGPFSETRTFVIDLPPPAPLLVSPPDGAVSVSTTVTLFWHPVTQEMLFRMTGRPARGTRRLVAPSKVLAEQRSLGPDNPEGVDSILYHVQVAEDSLFTLIVAEDSTITDTTSVAGPLMNISTYYWRVRARADALASPWSEVWAFSTASLPPVVSDIPDQTVPTGGRFTPIRMDLYVADPDDPDAEITWSVSGDDHITFTWDPLRRRYKIRQEAGWAGSDTVLFTATDPDGSSDSDSSVFTVTPPGTLAKGAGEEIPATFVLGQNYPNPFNPSTTIRFGVPVHSRVRIELFSVLGQRVGLIADGQYAPGYHSTVFATPLASGTYFYRLEAVAVDKPGEPFIDIRRLVIVK
jgi:hypothetical protein